MFGLERAFYARGLDATKDTMMKKTSRSVSVLMIAAGLCFFGCTKEGEDPEISRLHKSIESLEKEISSAEQALKTAPSENATDLQNNQELSKSRLERLKERLKAKGGAPAASSSSSGGGHH